MDPSESPPGQLRALRLPDSPGHKKRRTEATRARREEGLQFPPTAMPTMGAATFMAGGPSLSDLAPRALGHPQTQWRDGDMYPFRAAAHTGGPFGSNTATGTPGLARGGTALSGAIRSLHPPTQPAPAGIAAAPNNNNNNAPSSLLCMPPEGDPWLRGLFGSIITDHGHIEGWKSELGAIKAVQQRGLPLARAISHAQRISQLESLISEADARMRNRYKEIERNLEPGGATEAFYGPPGDPRRAFSFGPGGGLWRYARGFRNGGGVGHGTAVSRAASGGVPGRAAAPIRTRGRGDDGPAAAVVMRSL